MNSPNLPLPPMTVSSPALPVTFSACLSTAALNEGLDLSGLDALYVSDGLAWGDLDADARAVSAIKENLRATGLADRARVVQADVLRYLADRQGHVEPRTFDIAFADPPYAWDEWPALLAVVPARIVAIEARAHLTLPPEWHPLRSKRYGDTVVTLARRVEGE